MDLADGVVRNLETVTIGVEELGGRDDEVIGGHGGQ